jgi:hypothetical protein
LKLPEEVKKESEFAILPENVAALEWFIGMQTQWRTGFSGMTGMDYGVFLMWAKDEGLKRKERVDLLEDLRLMEGAFLGEIQRSKADP